MSAKESLNSMEDQDLAMLLRYIKIQEAENAAILGKSNKEILQLFMNKRAEQDPAVRKAYTENPLGKTIDDAYDYIFDYARKNAHGQNMAALTSMTVFQMVEQYFTNQEIKKFEKAKPAAAPTTKTKKPSAIDTLKAEIESITRSSQDWENAHLAKVEKWVKEHSGELFFNPDENPYLKETNPHLDKLTAKEQQLQQLLESKPASEPAPQEPEPEPETDSEQPDEDAIGEMVTKPTIINLNGDIVNTATGEQINQDLPEETPEEDVEFEIEEEDEETK